jgi:hypothetical protein
MNRRVANPNCVRLTSYTKVTDIDIVITGRQVDPSARTQGDVAAAGGVVKEGERAVSSIFAASCGS